MAALDPLDGDPDLEEEPDHEEGHDREHDPADLGEPDLGDCCNWQDEGGQTILRQLEFSPSRHPSAARKGL